jgi:hypothetical protein
LATVNKGITGSEGIGVDEDEDEDDGERSEGKGLVRKAGSGGCLYS